MAKEIESAINAARPALSAAQRGAKILGKKVGELQLSYRAGVIQGKLEAARSQGTSTARPPLSSQDRAILESMLREDPRR